MNNICSETEPANPNVGDLWYNTNDNEFYVFDYDFKWDKIVDETTVFDIIAEEGNGEDPVEAYDRAMGII